MEKKESVLKAVSTVIKFVGVAFFCIFFVLIINHFYRIKEYATALSKNLNVAIFFDNNVRDNENVVKAIEATQLVSVREHVNASEAYAKAVKKNPILKDVSVPDDLKAMQAYVVVVPKSIPDEDFILKMRNSLEKISGIDEVVFDASAFEHYVKIENLKLFCQKISCIFVVLILILFILKVVSSFLKGGLKESAKNIFSYVIASAFGFFAVWIVQYSLVISGGAILCSIFFAAIIGIIMDNI
ncbi:MAG: hypothetical protein LBU29_03440 [Endomicrobium sp.]|jgi:cell division transport system permease protein|nr:hypothetical protein [Endomicrobium sp.]